MTSPDGRQRLGLLAFAFDGAGREVLDVLISRPGLGDAFVMAHHAVAGDGAVEAEELVEGEEGDGREEATEIEVAPAWLRCAPGERWEPAPWSGGPEGAEHGFEAAVKDALDQRRWIDGQGIDLLDLVLLAPSGEAGHAVALSSATFAVLRTLRRRYQRIGRILLMVERPFDFEGEAGVPARLTPLPLWERPELQLFDLVLVRATVNLDGLAINDRRQAAADAAATLVQVTVGALAPTLYPRLQTHAAARPRSGRYVAVGQSEWQWDAGETGRRLGDALFARLAQRFSEQVSAVREDEARVDGEEASAADPWLQSVRQLLDRQPRDPAPSLDETMQQNRQSLAAVFRQSGWSLAEMRSRLDARLEALLGWERRERLDLVEFLQRFAPIYARWMAKEPPPARRTPPPPTERTDFVRLLLFLLAVLVTAGGVAAALYSSPWWWLAAAAGLVASVILARLGWTEKVPAVDKPEPKEPPPADPSAQEMLRELALRRSRLQTCEELRRFHQRQAATLEANHAALRRPVPDAPDGQPDGAAFLSPPVCAALLDRRHVDTAELLGRFWEENGGASALLASADGELSHRLRGFTRHSCEDLGEVGWRELHATIESDAEGFGDFWQQALDQARHASVPPVPVRGQQEFGLIALPEALPEELRERLTRQFAGEAEPVEVAGEGVVVLQVMQGFEEAGEGEV